MDAVNTDFDRRRPRAEAPRSLLRRLAAGFWLAASLLVALPLAAAEGDLELIMVEEAGCIYCAQWTAEVGGEYPLTPEGRAAPLRRIDLHDPILSELDLTSRPRLTPTFILMRDGEEIRRLEGYPGEHFFWPILAEMLKLAGAEVCHGC